MLTPTTKRHLFGNALRGAGIVAVASTTSTAIAEFVPIAPSAGVNSAYINAFPHFGPSEDVNNAAMFAVPQSFADESLTITSGASRSVMGVDVDVLAPTPVFGVAVVVQNFTVDHPTNVLFEWDLLKGNVEDFAEGLAYIHQTGYGLVGGLFAETHTTAAHMLTLLPGETYLFTAYVQVNGTTHTYIRLSVVPAPGALALLGISMISTRRRRRE